MATKAINNIVRRVSPKSLFESAKAVISSSVSFNQGDLLALDTTNHILKAVTASTDAPNFLGVARCSISAGKIVSPYQGTAVDASQAIEDIAGPEAGDVVSLFATAGDAYVPGCLVYLTATDAQTITSVDPGTHDPIGIYQGVNVASATSGQKIDVMIGYRYGAGVLAF